MPTSQALQSAKTHGSARSPAALFWLIGLVAAACFSLGLRNAPFVDEYAYITQSYQPDLVFAGKLNDISWLDTPGYDLVPLPKYWINLAFRAAAIARRAPQCPEMV